MWVSAQGRTGAGDGAAARGRNLRVRTVGGIAGSLAGLGVMWASFGEGGLIFAGFSGLLVVLVALGLFVRRGNHRAARVNKRARGETVRRLDAVDQQLEALAPRLDEMVQRVDSMAEAWQAVLEGVDEGTAAMASLIELVERLRDQRAMADVEFEGWRTRVDRELQTADRARRDLFSQVEASIALDRALSPDAPLIGSRGWAASPDILLFLYSQVRERRPGLVVECGSGLSTVVMAYALRSLRQGKVVALEHQDDYAERTRALLRRHGLGDWAEVRTAPLEPIDIDGETRPWYRVGSVPTEPVGLLFVDGPPADAHEDARLPALPIMAPRLESDALVVLDDYYRTDERRIVERWLESFPDWKVEILDHEKGTAVLSRTS